MLVLTDSGVGESSGVSSRLGSLRDVMFVCPSSQLNSALVSASVVVVCKKVKLLRPKAVCWARRERSKAGSVREVRLDIRSRARVKVAVSNASLCWMTYPLSGLVSDMKNGGHQLQMNVDTKSAKSLRDASRATSFSNWITDSELVSILPYKAVRAANAKGRDITAYDAAAGRGRKDIT